MLVAQFSPPKANPIPAPGVGAAPVTEPPSTPAPADAKQVPQQQTAAKPALTAPPASDTNAPLGPLAKQREANAPVGPAGVAEEDRGASGKQSAQVLKGKDVARSDADKPSPSKGESTSLPAAPPLPPRMVASGLREGAGGLSRVTPSERPQPMAETKTPALGSGSGNVAGVVGGVTGGMPGGVPSAAPPAPATLPPPKTEAQPSQSARSPGAQQQGAAPQAKPSQVVSAQSGLPAEPTPSQMSQGQQGVPSVQLAQGPLAGRSQLDQVRQAQQQREKVDNLQVKARAYSVDGLPSPDVRSLFYGATANPATFGRAGIPGGAGGSADASGQPQKKVAAEAEVTQAARQAVAVNAMEANSKAVQARTSNLGVRYNLLRKTAAGAFEQVNPDGVEAGDIIELQLMPNDRGTLLVRGRTGSGDWRDVMKRAVEARQTYITQPLKPRENELQVTLTRLPFSVTGAALRDEISPARVSRQSTTEPATYVVAGPDSRQLQFTITVNYK